MTGDDIKWFLPRVVRDYLANIDNHIDSMVVGLNEARRERTRLAARIARLELISETLTDETSDEAKLVALLEKEDILVFDLFGTPLILHDHSDHLASIIVDELHEGSFGLHTIDFRPGDIVIDVGANIGPDWSLIDVHVDPKDHPPILEK